MIHYAYNSKVMPESGVTRDLMPALRYTRAIPEVHQNDVLQERVSRARHLADGVVTPIAMVIWWEKLCPFKQGLKPTGALDEPGARAIRVSMSGVIGISAYGLNY
jgi:hypothetical protein